MKKPVINSVSDCEAAKNAYYNGGTYKGLVGSALFSAISNYNIPGSGQHFGKTKFEGSTKNKATI